MYICNICGKEVRQRTQVIEHIKYAHTSKLPHNLDTQEVLDVVNQHWGVLMYEKLDKNSWRPKLELEK